MNTRRRERSMLPIIPNERATRSCAIAARQ
jgi:hypothetical protein